MKVKEHHQILMDDLIARWTISIVIQSDDWSEKIKEWPCIINFFPSINTIFKKLDLCEVINGAWRNNILRLLGISSRSMVYGLVIVYIPISWMTFLLLWQINCPFIFSTPHLYTFRRANFNWLVVEWAKWINWWVCEFIAQFNEDRREKRLNIGQKSTADWHMFFLYIRLSPSPFNSCKAMCHHW